MIEFKEELFENYIDEAMPLLENHWREISAHQDIVLNVDVDTYKQLQELGVLRIYTAREDEKLVGYAVYFVKENPHYKQSLQANQDVIFIDKKKRGLFGAKFIMWCDEQLRDEGVQVVYQHVKVQHNWGKLLERMGYKPTDIIYSKRLDK